MNELPFDPDLDYNADITTYRRTRARLCEARGDPKVEAMIRDVDYILEWLETGRRPGNKRGVERLAAYQREIPTDLIEKYMQPTPPLSLLSQQDFERMEYILCMLTDRERECYEMHVAGMATFREIGEALGINHKTVHETVKRAEQKIKQYKRKPTPLLLEIVV